MSSSESLTSTLLAEISSIFEWMPTCTLIIDKEVRMIEINPQALLFFNTQAKTIFFDRNKTNNVFIDNQIINDIIGEILNTGAVIKRKILLRRFDKTIACVDAEIAKFPKTDNYWIIQFLDNSHDSHIMFTEIVTCLKNEIIQLKPYLNKPGKDLLEQIVRNDKFDGILKNEPLHYKKMDLIRREKLHSIAELWPELSIGEMELCAYLSLKMTFDEIAKISGKTPNSLRVAYHRIVGKTDFLNGKELLKKLQNMK